MKTSNKLLLGLLAFILIAFTSIAIYAKLHFHFNALKGEGQKTEQERPTPAFSKVTAEGSLDIFLTEGESPRITLKGYPNLLQEIETQTVDGELIIRLKSPLDLEEDMEVHLTVHDLQQLNLAGGTEVKTVTPLKGNGIKITGDGAVEGDLELLYDELICESTAGTHFLLKGTVPKAAFVFETGSELEADQLNVSSCLVKGSSGATGVVNVSKDLSAQMERGASLKYSGTAVLKDIKTESGGSVDKK